MPSEPDKTTITTQSSESNNADTMAPNSEDVSLGLLRKKLSPKLDELISGNHWEEATLLIAECILDAHKQISSTNKDPVAIKEISEQFRDKLFEAYPELVDIPLSFVIPFRGEASLLARFFIQKLIEKVLTDSQQADQLSNNNDKNPTKLAFDDFVRHTLSNMKQLRMMMNTKWRFQWNYALYPQFIIKSLSNKSTTWAGLNKNGINYFVFDLICFGARTTSPDNWMALIGFF